MGKFKIKKTRVFRSLDAEVYRQVQKSLEDYPVEDQKRLMEIASKVCNYTAAVTRWKSELHFAPIFDVYGVYFSHYVKRLGQWHVSRVDRVDGRTLCGKPMLGNNYEADIPEHKRVKCEKCWMAVELGKVVQHESND